MGMEEIEEKIRETGRKEAEIIMRDAEKEAELRRKEFREEARKKADAILRDAEREAELVKRRIIADSNLRMKEMIDNKRNEVIEEAFEKARKKIMGLGNSEKKRILEKLAEEGRKQLENPVVLVDRKYLPLLKGAKPLKINDFGVMVRSRKGKAEVNNTLSKKLGQMNENLRHSIAEVLFK